MTRALRHGIVTKKDIDNTVCAMKFLHTKKDGVTKVLTILYKMFEIA